MRLIFPMLLFIGLLHAKAAPCPVSQGYTAHGKTMLSEMIPGELYADLHRPVPSGRSVNAVMEQERSLNDSPAPSTRPQIQPVRWGPTVEANWYSLRDFDPTWGISFGLYKVRWHGIMEFYLEQPKGHPMEEPVNRNIMFEGLRLGWFPFEGSHQDDVTHMVYDRRAIRSATQNVGFSYEGHVYFLQYVTTGIVPLNDTISFVLRYGSGLSWIEIREVSDIVIDGTDHTDDFTFEHDYSLDWHLLIGAGLEARTRDEQFSVGAMLGYRFVIMEYWGLNVTYRDPRTGRERTSRGDGVELFGGMTRGVTGSLYLRYAF